MPHAYLRTLAERRDLAGLGRVVAGHLSAMFVDLTAASTTALSQRLIGADGIPGAASEEFRELNSSLLRRLKQRLRGEGTETVR